MASDRAFRFGATIRSRVSGNYTMVEWEDVKAKLIRPNLECTNGYIHIIDRVIMKRRDVTLIAKAGKAETMPIVVAIAIVAALAFNNRN